jgi:hypothetical protein
MKKKTRGLLTMRLTDDDNKVLAALQKKLGKKDGLSKESQIIRLALRRLAEQEGIKPP